MSRCPLLLEARGRDLPNFCTWVCQRGLRNHTLFLAIFFFQSHPFSCNILVKNMLFKLFLANFGKMYPFMNNIAENGAQRRKFSRRPWASMCLIWPIHIFSSFFPKQFMYAQRPMLFQKCDMLENLICYQYKKHRIAFANSARPCK